LFRKSIGRVDRVREKKKKKNKPPQPPPAHTQPLPTKKEKRTPKQKKKHQKNKKNTPKKTQKTPPPQTKRPKHPKKKTEKTHKLIEILLLPNTLMHPPTTMRLVKTFLERDKGERLTAKTCPEKEELPLQVSLVSVFPISVYSVEEEKKNHSKKSGAVQEKKMTGGKGYWVTCQSITRDLP